MVFTFLLPDSGKHVCSHLIFTQPLFSLSNRCLDDVLQHYKMSEPFRKMVNALKS